MWLAVISQCLQLLVMLTSYFSSRRAISSVEAEIASRLLKETQDAIHKAKDARARVRADIQRDPSKLRQHDRFERPED